jgi:hypothetical protein
MEKDVGTGRMIVQIIFAVVGSAVITSTIGLFALSSLAQQLMSGAAEKLFNTTKEIGTKISIGITATALSIIFGLIAYTIYKMLSPKAKLEKGASDTIVIRANEGDIVRTISHNR